MPRLIIVQLLLILILSLIPTRSFGQTAIQISLNSYVTGTTFESTPPIFSNFTKRDNFEKVGLAGQRLFWFTIPSVTSFNSMDILLSTCEGSKFDTYLVLFDRDPTVVDTKSNNNNNNNIDKIMSSVIAESANDILCEKSIDRASIRTKLSEGTYYILLTGNENSYGKYNLTLFATPLSLSPTPVPWHLDRIDQRYLPFNDEYTVTNTADDIYVYLIDSGVNIHHEEFEGRVQVGYDFVRYTETDTPDCTGHGTHSAALIGGKTFGVAKKVTIISVRIYGCDHKASVPRIIDALNWVLAHSEQNAVQDRSVIALMVSNLGEPSAIFESVLRGIILSQIPVIVPAGDQMTDKKDDENFDACKYHPANEEAFIAVGATTRTDSRATFSRRGDCVLLYAPGVDIESAWHSSNNAMATMSGTAQAVAILTGTTALLLSINNGIKSPDIRNVLHSVGTPNVVPVIGNDNSARLVYVRSIPTDRKRIPEKGFVFLQALFRVNFPSCESSTHKTEILKTVLAELTELEEKSVSTTCERIVVDNSEEGNEDIENNDDNKDDENSDTDFDTDAAKETTVPVYVTTRQDTGDVNHYVEVIFYVIERRASNAFLLLERGLMEGKEEIERKVSFTFEVVEVPWATDSKEIIYWGAPTFPDTRTGGLSAGIIIAIIMSGLLVLCVIVVVIWLWIRRITKKDEIESMEGSADMEKGPVHFQDFDDEDSGIQKSRSFRNLNLKRISSLRQNMNGRNSSGGSHRGGGAQFSSLASFATKGGGGGGEVASMGMDAVRLESFGGEAFAGVQDLHDKDDKKETAEHDNWRNLPQGKYAGFGRLNSTVPGVDNDDDFANQDTMVVKSMGGEAFAVLAQMASLQAEENDQDKDSGDPLSNVETQGERMVQEGDSIVMSPRGTGHNGFQ